MKKLEIGDGLGSIRCFSLQHFTRSMRLGDGFGFDWGVEFGPIEGKLWEVELSLVRVELAESDYIRTGTLTYRIQADTCRESAATNVKFVLTGISVSIRLGTLIFRYEPAGTARTGRYLEP
ncbi:hypothetical protein CsSME_00009327 [Camellia sinensis var. sinensis]